MLIYYGEQTARTTADVREGDAWVDVAVDTSSIEWLVSPDGGDAL